MLNIKDLQGNFLTELVNVKVAAHVLWVEGCTTEVVSSFMDGDVYTSGFLDLKYRVDSFMSNAKLTAADFDCYRNDEPGCNYAIFTVEFKNCRYQLNFVEVV